MGDAASGESTHLRERVEGVARELGRGGLGLEPGGERMRPTRRVIVQGWEVIAERLEMEGNWNLASLVRRFVGQTPPPSTERQRISERLRQHTREREGPTR